MASDGVNYEILLKTMEVCDIKSPNVNNVQTYLKYRKTNCGVMWQRSRNLRVNVGVLRWSKGPIDLVIFEYG